MKTGFWLCGAVLMSVLAIGCPEDSGEGGEQDAAAGGGSNQGSDAASSDGNDGSTNDAGSAVDGGSAVDAGSAADGGSAVDAGSAGSGGSAAGHGGSSGGAGSGSSPVVCTSSTDSGHWGQELASAFRRVNGTFCGRCSKTDPNRSNCLEAPVSEERIICIRDAVCSNETLIDGARCMQGGLDTRNANCNFEGELSCDNGCWDHSAGDAHLKSCGEDLTFGAALSKCGIDLTPSGL